MPHAYCTTCEATVTVGEGRCLAGHVITTPIIESSRGRHRAPSRWDKLRPGRIMTAGHHRADRTSDQPPRPSIDGSRATKPPPGPLTPPPDESRKPHPAPQVIPRRVATNAPSSPWHSPEAAPRPVYSSSMLEMLGLDEDAGYEPTFTTMTSPQPVWQATAAPPKTRRAGLERLPTLSDMRKVNDSRTDTGTLIERLWFATEEHDAVRPAEDLRAGDFAEAPARTFRWSVVIAAVLVLALAAAMMQVGVRLPVRLADEAIATYRTAITDARAVLPAAEDVMLEITDPTVTIDGLADAAVILSRLDKTARNLFTTASEPLSSTPPLVSRRALDELTPLRADMANASQDGLAIEQRLGDALTYRLVFDKAFALPELPVTASPDRISALGVELGLGLAATLDALESLPRDPAFEAHRAQADNLAARYAEWQVLYLGVLRSSDLTATTAIVEELQAAVDELRSGIAVPLRTVAAWGADEIDRFDKTLAQLAERSA